RRGARGGRHRRGRGAADPGGRGQRPGRGRRVRRRALPRAALRLARRAHHAVRQRGRRDRGLPAGLLHRDADQRRGGEADRGGGGPMRIQDVRELIETRVHEPGAIAAAAARRARPASPLGAHGKVMIVAADHPARGALRSGGRAMAMADRADLLDRLCAALARPGVTGVLATADILEDLLLLGALEGKTAVGSMNRGGLAGAAWEIDDRFTGYDAAGIERMRFDGGKMLLRLDYADGRTAGTMEGCARAADQLNERRLMAMIEPFISYRDDGAIRNDLSTDAVARSAAIA